MSQLLMRRPRLDDLPPIPPLPPGFTLRTFEPQDLEPLAALLQRAFEDPNWTPEKVRQTLVDAPDVMKIYVIDHEGRPVATASARLVPDRFPGSGYLHWVGVDPEYRGQRLGAIVSLAVLHEFARMGCQDAVLETDDHRLAAIKIYQEMGFEPVHTDESHILRWAKIASDLLAAANL